MRVVQIEPGPMPTLTASAPASISASAPSAVATLPAMIWVEFESRLMRPHHVEDARGMAVRGIDHQHIDARVEQRLGARDAVLARAGRGRRAQPAVLVLAGVGESAATSRCPSP